MTKEDVKNVPWSFVVNILLSIIGVFGYFWMDSVSKTAESAQVKADFAITLQAALSERTAKTETNQANIEKKVDSLALRMEHGFELIGTKIDNIKVK